MLARGKFSDPIWTAKGERRATVAIPALKTLWFNTGTLCNITCAGCYIESSPRNDRLAYLSLDDVTPLLAEARLHHPSLGKIGFTGGEPFMNPQIITMIEDALQADYRVLVLTNAMKPMHLKRRELASLRARFGERLTIRVSLDHYAQQQHEDVRGPRTWAPALAGLKWLSDNGFGLAVAARLIWPEGEAALRTGFAAMFEAHGIRVNAQDPHALVLFPDMDDNTDVAEITESCWDILHKDPRDVMCASARMVVRRKGDSKPSVVACTLIPYDPQFELGHTLADAMRPVSLNHRHCAKFCVLGGASCSG
jgi:uncharacterized Fe-S cluster-containing radical SAM superfamily protein